MQIKIFINFDNGLFIHYGTVDERIKTLHVQKESE
jgi:hypothetical protein